MPFANIFFKIFIFFLAQIQAINPKLIKKKQDRKEKSIFEDYQMYILVALFIIIITGCVGWIYQLIKKKLEL